MRLIPVAVMYTFFPSKVGAPTCNLQSKQIFSHVMTTGYGYRAKCVSSCRCFSRIDNLWGMTRVLKLYPRFTKHNTMQTYDPWKQLLLVVCDWKTIKRSSTWNCFITLLKELLKPEPPLIPEWCCNYFRNNPLCSRFQFIGLQPAFAVFLTLEVSSN